MPADNTLLFGNKLRKARFELELPRRELLSKLSFKSGATIQCWENGSSLPKETLLEKIAECYKIDLQELTILWKITKDARDILKCARKSLKHTPEKNDGECFPGSISSKEALRAQTRRSRIFDLEGPSSVASEILPGPELVLRVSGLFHI